MLKIKKSVKFSHKENRMTNISPNIIAIKSSCPFKESILLDE